MGQICPCGEGPAKLVTAKCNKSGTLVESKSAFRVSSTRRSTGGIKLPNNSGKHPKDAYKMDNKPVGIGAFGTVRIAENRSSGKKAAIKTIEWTKIKDKEAFRNEIEINSMMDHPNIARLFETFEDNRHAYLAMELCRGGELFDYIIEQQHFHEKHARIFMDQIVRAVRYMHSNCVAHRDLKPENFLLMKPCKEVSVEDNTLKIIDFGIAKKFEKPPEGKDGKMTMKTKAGTMYYIAPEILKGGYNEKCDIWSCGVIMYILLSGSPPFGGDDDREIKRQVLQGHIDFSIEEFQKTSEQAKSLIRNMCNMDVAKRFNGAQTLEDPWMKRKSKEDGGWGLFNKSDEANPEWSQNLVANLKRFTHVNRFQKEALNVMAHRLEDEQIKKLRAVFLKLDDDGNGMLTLNELKAGCAKAGVTNNEELTYLFEEMDHDHSGSISYSEFLAAMVEQKHTVNKPLCWEAFRIFDINGDGKIKEDEFLEIMKTSDDVKLVNDTLHTREEEELRKIFREADKDKNGEVDFEEFYEMLNC